MPLTYSDDLIPVGEWPGIVANYRIGPSSSSGPAEPVVTVTLEMTSHNLVVGSTQGVTSVQEAAAQLAGKLNHVYYQASQPDVAFAAFANLDCDTPHPLPSCAVKDFVAACCVHTAAVGRQRQMIYAVPGSAVSLRDAASTIGVAPGDLLALNGTSAASALFDSGLTLPCYVASGPDDTLQTLADRARVTVEALVAQNSTLGAAAGARLTVSPSIATVPSPSGTLAALAAASAVSPAILAQANDTTAGLIVANMPLSMGAVGIVTGEGATFASLVLAFLEVGAPETITVADVAAAAANVEGLLAPGSKLTFSQCIAAKGSTLGELAASIPGFASLNAATPGVLGPGSRVLIGTSAADWPTIKDEKLLDIAATAAVSIQEVAAVNGDQALAPGATLAVPGLVSLTAGPGLFAPYTAVVGDTLANVCVKLGGAAPDLVGVINQNRPSILAVGERILPAVTPGVPPYTIVQGDTLRSIFSHYETLGIPTFEAFIESVAGLDNLLPPGAVVIGPVATATADSLAAIAAGTGVELSQIVAANAALQNFLKAGAQVSLPDPNDPAKPVTLTVGGWDSFNTLVARFAGRGIVTTAQDLARAYAAEPGMVTIGQAFLLPPKSLALSVTVQRSNPALVSPIIVTLEVSRDPTLAPGAPASAVTARSTLGGAAGANQSGALSFGGFAEEFESAYPGLKLATTKAGPSRLWWVDFGGTGITVAPSPGGVTAYALPPLSNRLMARTGVPIEPFVPAGEQ
jgi:phage tail protein X